MTYNPYEAPQAGYVQEPEPKGAGEPQPWEVGEVLSKSFAIAKTHWSTLAAAMLLLGLVALLVIAGLVIGTMASGTDASPFTVQGMLGMSTPGAQIASLSTSVVLLIVMSFFGAGLNRMMVTAARGETPNLAQMFGGADRFRAMLGLRGLLALPGLVGSALGAGASAAGLVSLVGGLRAVVLLLGFAVFVLQVIGLGYAEFFLVDARQGPLEALRSAWRATVWCRGKLVLFALASGSILVASCVCCGLPLLLSYPVILIAMAMIYLRVSGR